MNKSDLQAIGAVIALGLGIGLMSYLETSTNNMYYDRGVEVGRKMQIPQSAIFTSSNKRLSLEIIVVSGEKFTLEEHSGVYKSKEKIIGDKIKSLYSEINRLETERDDLSKEKQKEDSMKK